MASFLTSTRIKKEQTNDVFYDTLPSINRVSIILKQRSFYVDQNEYINVLLDYSK